MTLCQIKEIFKQQLQILDNDFIFHAGKEQVDEYNCGVFALANLEVMAKLIRSNPSNSNSLERSESGTLVASNSGVYVGFNNYIDHTNSKNVNSKTS